MQEVVFWGGEVGARLLQDEEESGSGERTDGGNWEFRPKALVLHGLRYAPSSSVAPSVPGRRSTLEPNPQACSAALSHPQTHILHRDKNRLITKPTGFHFRSFEKIKRCYQDIL